MMTTAYDTRLFPLFSHLPHDLVCQVQARLVERTAARHHFVFKEGDPCEGLFLLTRGRVKLSRNSADGRELALAILHPGDHFDVAPIFDNGPQMMSAQALDDVSMVLIPKADLLALAERHPGLASTLLATVFGALRQLTDLVEHVSTKSVTGRLAEFLLEASPDGRSVVLDISQRDIAALVGTRREVVSRALGRLERDGILHVMYPRITILDAARLRRLT
jgi:CRP/FNR family transcriptional regulator